MEDITLKIKEKLPLCGSCPNCKIIAWSDIAELSKRPAVQRLRGEDSLFFTVRCNWLKTPIEDPMQLIVCEGKNNAGGRGNE